jgi:hypothetical protein
MATASPDPKDPASAVPEKSDAWTDLGLTLPIFLLYHLGVVFLPVRNAADPVTKELTALAEHNILGYAGLTIAIGIAFVVVLAATGQKKALERKRFVLIAIEGTVYAMLMRFAASYVVGSLTLGPNIQTRSAFSGVIMSMGAGFYEEIAFRVGLRLGRPGPKSCFWRRNPPHRAHDLVGWCCSCRFFRLALRRSSWRCF